LEDILGVIIFVIFIVIRAMGDRKKGMKKEPVAKKAKPLIETKRVEPAPSVKSPMGKPRLERKALEPTFMGAYQKEHPRAQFQIGEGESDYDRLPMMEGVEPDSKDKVFPILEVEEQTYYETALFRGADDLRKAIIWSEIIQKPRFRTKMHRPI